MMKQNENYVMTELGDDVVLIPIGEAAEKFRGIIRLNITARDIWLGLSNGLTEEQIATKLVDDYEGVDYMSAKQKVHELVKKLHDAGVLFD